MKTKVLTCVICPNGCELTVRFEEAQAVEVAEITGHLCDKGPQWAEQELTNPMRTIASSILVQGGDFQLVSVRTDAPIPLERIADVMNAVKAVRVQAPVHIGQTLIQAPAGTDCNIIATRHVQATQQHRP